MDDNNVVLKEKPTEPTESQINNKFHQNASAKHSGPFYISPLLFDNKRLRRKRLRWAKALLVAAGFKLKQKKTERSKRDLSALRPDVTIDLLSDDEQKSYNSNTDQTKNVLIEKSTSKAMSNGPPPLVPLSNKSPSSNQLLSLVYPNQSIEISKVPNITLIPVQNLTNAAAPPIASVAPMPRRVKRKRKSQLPKRHEQPTIVNNESIVLSDDSDIEVSSALTAAKTKKHAINALDSPVSTTATGTLPSATLAHMSPQSQSPPTPSKPTKYPTLLTPYSGQVDEEVTVSIVPRSSSAGACPKAEANELFPMLPDETTVHTVIANRTYELSLTKLREGLASCGIPEFANGQQKVTTTRRKGQIVDTPPMVSPTPAPISLKLSSDLSISLISDDDDDILEQQQQQRLAAESLLQKQPQLMVQHLQLPAGGILPSGANVALVGPPRMAPRRRKLC
ncbi:protein a6-like [Rhagoletis pomonella]|uniref:protein a6-like n=1 Tax=Rhagoletis pomonella TaxID=28610 RepID=UPI00177EE482|nr:protein a6-like [Rhagoletis pomonella]